VLDATNIDLGVLSRVPEVGPLLTQVLMQAIWTYELV